ncbi:MAG: hypothetical protein ACREQ9_19795, partial [Candidatus Binatia bacterium]
MKMAQGPRYGNSSETGDGADSSMVLRQICHPAGRPPFGIQLGGVSAGPRRSRSVARPVKKRASGRDASRESLEAMQARRPRSAHGRRRYP